MKQNEQEVVNESDDLAEIAYKAAHEGAIIPESRPTPELSLRDAEVLAGRLTVDEVLANPVVIIEGHAPTDTAQA